MLYLIERVKEFVHVHSISQQADSTCRAAQFFGRPSGERKGQKRGERKQRTVAPGGHVMQPSLRHSVVIRPQ